MDEARGQGRAARAELGLTWVVAAVLTTWLWQELAALKAALEQINVEAGLEGSKSPLGLPSAGSPHWMLRHEPQRGMRVLRAIDTGLHTPLTPLPQHLSWTQATHPTYTHT